MWENCSNSYRSHGRLQTPDLLCSLQSRAWCCLHMSSSSTPLTCSISPYIPESLRLLWPKDKGQLLSFYFRRHNPFPLTRPWASWVHMKSTGNVCFTNSSFCFLVLTISSTAGVPHLLYSSLHTQHLQREQCYKIIKILSLPNHSLTVSYHDD